MEENAQGLSARKRFRIFCGGYPSTDVLRYSQMTFSENNCERYSFFLPKKCVKECLRLIFPTFLEVYFLCFAKTYPKDSCEMFLGDTPQKTCEQGCLSQTFLFTVQSFCCKVPNVQGMFRKMSLTKYLAENIPTKNPNNF